VRWLVVFFVACSVAPVDLEGKQCPCVAGYACDMTLNLCRPVNDGGGLIDSGSITPCLGTPGMELYRYAGTFDWQKSDGSWTGGAQIVQNSGNAMDSYTFTTQPAELGTGNYRVIAAMKPTGSGNALGIAMRAATGTKNRYQCMWHAKDRELRLEYHSSNSTTLGSVIVPTASQTAGVTMEARITGSPATLSCCLREYATAKLLDVQEGSAGVANGFPGLATDRAAATFPSFSVYAP